MLLILYRKHRIISTYINKFFSFLTFTLQLITLHTSHRSNFTGRFT